MSNLIRIKFKNFITLQRGVDLPRKDMNVGPYPVIGSTSIIGYHDEYKVEPPGVITGRSGSLGFVQYIREKYWPHNTALWVKDFKENQPRYVYYFLQTLDLQRFNSGAGVPTLNRNDLDDLDLAIHPIPVQDKIASILSAYDDLIENNNRRIKILEEMAQAIYKEWFVNFRFPGHEKAKMVKSKQGMIPEGWECIPLNKLLDSFGGDWGEDNPTETETESVYIIRGADIRHLEKGLPSDVPLRYIKPESYRKKQLSAGDVIVENSVNAKSRSVGTSLLVTEGLLKRLKEKATFATFCRCFRPKKKEYGAFIHLHMQYLRKEHLIEYFQNVATNGIANFQSQMFLAKNMIPFPVNEDMQNDLLELLNQLTASTLADKNFNLIKTRDLLLPKLISGEIDVEKTAIRMKNETV